MRLKLIIFFLLGVHVYSSGISDSLFYYKRVEPILKSKCIQCHFGGPEGVLIFDTTSYGMGLFNKLSNTFYDITNPDPAERFLVVSPGSLDSSILFLVIAYSPKAGYIFPNIPSQDKIYIRQRMPVDGDLEGYSYLTDSEIESIGKWILLLGGADTLSYEKPIQLSINFPLEPAFQKHKGRKIISAVSGVDLINQYNGLKLFSINGQHTRKTGIKFFRQVIIGIKSKSDNYENELSKFHF